MEKMVAFICTMERAKYAFNFSYMNTMNKLVNDRKNECKLMENVSRRKKREQQRRCKGKKALENDKCDTNKTVKTESHAPQKHRTKRRS